MKKIMTRQELQAIAKELGVRPDWHEPDEQELTAHLLGRSFDNAGFWGPEEPDTGMPHREMSIVLHVQDSPVAEINLATLFSWACETST